MSTVKADNFTWKTGQATGLTGTNITGDQLVYGVAKTWINYNGNSSLTVNKSFNVSSTTYNSFGDNTVAFTNSFVDTYYVIAGIISYYNNTLSTTNSRGYGNHIKSVSSIRSQTIYYSAINGAATVEGCNESNLLIVR